MSYAKGRLYFTWGVTTMQDVIIDKDTNKVIDEKPKELNKCSEKILMKIEDLYNQEINSKDIGIDTLFKLIIQKIKELDEKYRLNSGYELALAVAHSTHCIKTRSKYYEPEPIQEGMFYTWGLKKSLNEKEVEYKNDKKIKYQRLQEIKKILIQRNEITIKDAADYFKNEHYEKISRMTISRYFNDLSKELDEQGCNKYLLIIPEKISKNKPIKLKNNSNSNSLRNMLRSNQEENVSWKEFYKKFHG